VAIFLPYYAAALALVYFELRGHSPRSLPSLRLPAWVSVAALIVTYAVVLGLVWYASIASVPAQPWRVSLPIGVADQPIAHGNLVDAAMLIVTLLQSVLLLGLYRSPPSRILLIGGSGVMMAMSLAAPAFISPDPYAYVGDALLGAASYAPPPHDFAGTFAAIGHFFPAPMLPSPYGPFWTFIVGLATAAVPALLGKLLVLRFLGLVSFIALLAALRAYGIPARLLAAVALNPGLLLQYVACAHNDLLGIALLVAAAAVIDTSGLAACGLIAVAGLVKLPFVVLGLPVLAAVKPRALRYGYAALAAACALGISWWSAGTAYFRGLAVHVPMPGPAYALNVAVVCAALLAIGVAFLGGRRIRTAVWLIPMASSYVASWYLSYGLPYALARRRILAYLLVGFPFVDALVDAKFMQPWTFAIVVPLVAAVCIFFESRPGAKLARP
jgi:hypothetical protein